MAILNDWQRKEVEVMVIGNGGEIYKYKFMRVMLDYVQAIQEGLSPKEIREQMDINDTDLMNWRIAYPLFTEYIKRMSEQKAFSSQINRDFALGLLGHAAVGEKELSNQQLAAIKLIMQSNDILSKGPKVKAEKPKVTNFTLEEKDGGNGKV